MAAIATTKMSSKGQVVIPEEIRNRLGLKEGTRFVVVGDDDVVIFKSLSPPSMNEFSGLMEKARLQARKAGMTRSDLKAIVAKARKK